MKIAEKCIQALQSVIAGIVFQVVSASSAYAIDPESIIRNTTSYLQGSLARAMGVLTIVVCGFLCCQSALKIDPPSASKTDPPDSFFLSLIV